ncbi:hypothetical protein D1871_09360 [Nakamurella silvestris]|nr:hypothetical protein D1871_09360 [Nakamurella silvestris]
MNGTEVSAGLILRAGLECLALLAIVAYLLFRTDLRQKFYSLGTRALATVLIFLGAWGAVQMVDRWQYDYPNQWSPIPLTRFAMYQVQLKESVEETYSWQGVYTDGEQRELNLTAEFSTIGLPAMSTRMRVLLNWAQEPEGSADHQKAADELKLWATGLAKAAKDSEPQLKEIRFYEVTGHYPNPDESLLMSWSVDELAVG